MADSKVTEDVLSFDNLVNIFSYISPSDLDNASLVSRLWNEAAEASSLWKRHCLSRWSFCNLNVTPGAKTWKKYYIARQKVESGAASGRPGVDYMCKSLRGHKGVVTDVILTTSNDIYDESMIDKSAHPIVASCGKDRSVCLWNTREGKNIWKEYNGHEGSVSCLALIKANELFASGDELGIANLWDVTTGRHTRLQEDHSRISKMMCTSNNQLFIATRSGEVKIWDVRDTVKSQQTIQTPLMAMDLMTVKDHTIVLAGASNLVQRTSSGIKVYDVRNLVPEGFQPQRERHSSSSLHHHNHSNATCFNLVPNLPNQLVAGYNDGSLIVWDMKTFRQLSSFRPHVGSVTAMATVRSKVISSGTECSLSIWDLPKGRSLGSFVDHNLQITHIYGDSYKVMSCSRDFSIRVYSWVDRGDGICSIVSRYTLLGGSLQRARNGFEKIVCDYTTCVGMANDVMKAYTFQM